MGHLDVPDIDYPLPPLEEIPDNDVDKPEEACKLTKTIGGFPAIIFGAASFSHFYNEVDYNSGTTPLRTTRLALRYGITAFDTAPFYGDSEIILGNALHALEQEFPRASYTLITKVGRYSTGFDYSPEGIESSVARSLRRLHTSYLDVVYLHDVEFVADEKLAKREGNHATALARESRQYGLDGDQEGEAYSDKDHKVLAAVQKLFELRDERGIIKRVGISGYPIPTLLRIAILVQNRLGKPLDLVMSYCHLTLQNSTIEQFKPVFESRAGVKQVVTASPLCMGLLRPEPPMWHPAPAKIKDAVKSAVQLSKEWDASGTGLPKLALEYSFERAREAGMPTVVGLSTPEEVHASAKVWRGVEVEEWGPRIRNLIGDAKVEDMEDPVSDVKANNMQDIFRQVRVRDVQNLFRDAQVLDYSWALP